MAVGVRDLEKIREYINHINKSINNGKAGKDSSGNYDRGLFSCYNTFQYVSKYLQDWADETVAGSIAIDQLKKLSLNFGYLIDETLKINNKIIGFCDAQDNINGCSSEGIRDPKPGEYYVIQ